MTLRPALISLAALALAAACTSVGGGETSSSGASSSSTSSSTSSSGEGPCDFPTCNAGKNCFETWDNAASNGASLRISHITIMEPPVLSAGTVATIVAGALSPVLPTCELPTGGTFNWLIELDVATSTLTTGGATPVPDIFQGYGFFQGDLGGVPVTPATAPFTLDPGGALSISSPIDLDMPVFLDSTGAQFILLPLRSLALSAALSDDHNCVGDVSYEPPAGCLPDDNHPIFHNGGHIDAHLLLEEADTINIASGLNQSLCVLLSEDPSQYGDGGSPIERCARDSMGEILFHGDWCSATGAPATTACHDAVRFSADFAASAVKINP